MILTQAYSRRDIDQAERLMLWIGFLSAENGLSMKKERLLLIPSRSCALRLAHDRIVKLAGRIFGEVLLNVPRGEDERVWPFAPNFMFREALHQAELLEQDIFWLEPDAIPMKPDWFDHVLVEWRWGKRQHGKRFMGANVPMDRSEPHMSGIGAYSQHWRQYAPKLAEAEDIPWDLFANDQVYPHAHFANLSQHVWNEPRITDDYLERVINPGAVIFHQDKQGALIRLIDRRRYGGRVSKVLDKIMPDIMNPKYFYAENCSRTFESQGYHFQFEPYAQLGGTWRGTYVATDEGEQIALTALAGNASSGVKEITPEDYEARTKKKAESLNVSSPSKGSLLIPPTVTANLKAAIKDHPAGRPVVVDSSQPQATPPVAVDKDVEDLIKVGPVEMERTEQMPVKAKRPKRQGK